MTGGQGVEIEIDEIEQIGTGTMPALSEQTRSQTRPIRDSQPDPAAFGRLQAGQDFAQVEAAAKAIFVATVEGVERDLAEFGLKLQQSARNHRDNEDGVVAALAALNAEYVEGSSGAVHADTSYQQENAEQSEQLDADVIDRAGRGEAGGELPGEGAEPAAPAAGAETAAAEPAGPAAGDADASQGAAPEGGSPGWSP